MTDRTEPDLPGNDRAKTDTGQSQPPRRPALSARAAADELGINERTVRRWIDQGLIAAAKVRGAYRIDAGEIERARMALLGTDGAGHAVVDADQTADTTGQHQTAGHARAAPDARTAAAPGGAADAAPAVTPAAVAQLEAIRDQWLRPLVDRIEELSRETGRLAAERDYLAAQLAEAIAADRQRADAERERDELRAEVELLRSISQAAGEDPHPTQEAVSAPTAGAGATEPPARHSETFAGGGGSWVAHLWRRVRGRPG